MFTRRRTNVKAAGHWYDRALYVAATVALLVLVLLVPIALVAAVLVLLDVM
ncbi:hypothetical protein ABZS66_12005 [Dactylosporangium sp. NPDC005572]|uniref:hypothetical protein n=1 Tax=Dactylosporangium sp. NPDC005572 TaxID=3156889 RepID=UPI0033A30AEE